jgi:hypothetical protein
MTREATEWLIADLRKILRDYFAPINLVGRDILGSLRTRNLPLSAVSASVAKVSKHKRPVVQAEQAIRPAAPLD